MKTYTIQEAADLTGATAKALRRRIERGTIQSVVKDDLRRIPQSELVRVGLLAEDGTPVNAPVGQGQPQGAPQAGATDIAPLITRLEELVAENAKLRPQVLQLEQETGRFERQLAAERETAGRAAREAVEHRARAAELEGRLGEADAAVEQLRQELAAARQPKRRRLFARRERTSAEPSDLKA